MKARRRTERPRRRLFSYGEWRYAILVILLLVMAAVAAKLAVDALVRHPQLRGLEGVTTPISVTVFTLTFGFLFLAGGFGIWAIRTTNEVEGRRRIGRFVNDMGYLSDGLLTVDAKGRVTGMNPAARALCNGGAGGATSLAGLFPCLTPADLDGLAGRREAYEVERAFRAPGGALLGLRFRSQHTGEASLILVSDVTAAKERQAQDLQSNHLQILGRMARGVAHDFNNILCAISGEAALARRSGILDADALRSLESILGLSTRGAELAERLTRLSRMDSGEEPASDVEEHVKRAGEILKTVLHPGWNVEVTTRGFAPPVPLGGSQLEQIVLGTALTASDPLDRPGTVRIDVHAEGDGVQAGQRVSCVMITVSAGHDAAGEEQARLDEDHVIPADDTGVVASVVRALLEDHGGQLQVFPGSGGGYTYRIVLPALYRVREERAAGLGLPDHVRAALKGLRVLLALPQGQGGSDLQDRLRILGIEAEALHTLHDVLERIDRDPEPETMVIDRRLLGGEPNALILAILKLLPSSRLVIRSEAPSLDRIGLPDDVLFIPADAPTDSVLEALAEARDREPLTVG